ncbi:MAG: glycosyltransferase, partial [Christensenellaceae bacterium]
MKKHIVIDCFKQIKGEGKSIGIYNVAREITRVLSEQHPEATITVLGNEENRSDFALPNVNFLVMKGNPHRKLACVLWELFTVSRVLKKIKADVVIFPRGYAALTHPVEDVVMIHDMIPFYYHEHYRGFFSRLENFYVMTRLKASARSAKKVLTISEASKRDIVRYTGCDEAKIHVVYNGCSKIDYEGE